MECDSAKEDLLLQFIAKAIELVSDTKKIHSFFETNNDFAVPSTSIPWLRNSIQKNRKPGKQVFFLQIFQKISSFPPFLVEQWKFEVTPRRIFRQKDLAVVKQEITLSLKFLIQSSLTIAQRELQRPSLQLTTNPSELAQWDPSMTENNKEALNVISLCTGEAECTVTVEYLRDFAQPQILTRMLGNRPRVMSLDTEPEESPRSRVSSNSTDCDFSVKGFVGGRKLSLIDSETLLQEGEVGFKLISSELCSDAADDSDSEDWDNYTFEMQIEDNPFGEPVDEGTAVAEYKSRCERLKKTQLFHGTDSIFSQISLVMKEWSSLN